MHRFKKKSQDNPGDGMQPVSPAVELKPAPANFKPEKVITIPVGLLGMKLVMESRFIGMLVIAFVVYVFGALVANEWTYLLASGFVCAALTGALVPLLILL